MTTPLEDAVARAQQQFDRIEHVRLLVESDSVLGDLGIPPVGAKELTVPALVAIREAIEILDAMRLAVVDTALRSNVAVRAVAEASGLHRQTVQRRKDSRSETGLDS